MLIDPTGHVLRSTQKTTGPLSLAEVKLITDFEQWFRSRGFQMILICEHCYNSGNPDCLVQGMNNRDATTYKITCGHQELGYNTGITNVTH